MRKKIRRTPWYNKLSDACDEGLQWAKAQDSYAEAWRTCTRIDWLAWLVSTLVRGRPKSSLAKQAASAAIALARSQITCSDADKKCKAECRAALALACRYLKGKVSSSRVYRASMQLRAENSATWATRTAVNTLATPDSIFSAYLYGIWGTRTYFVGSQERAKRLKIFRAHIKRPRLRGGR